MLTDIEEKNLIRHAKAGNERAFETLILSCKGKAYSIAFRYMKNEEDAMDAVQESFLKIFKYLKKFNEQSKFDTWVYRIVVNTCMDMLRKQSNKNLELRIYTTDEDGNENMIEFKDHSPLPLEVMLERESRSQIAKCLDKLKEEQRQIIILRDVEGLSYEDICNILDCNLGTVKSRLSRARIKLREIYLSDREQNPDKFV